MPTRPGKHRPAQAHTPHHQPTLNERSSTKRGYGYRWQQERVAFLLLHPLCVKCEAEGRVVAATDVDHIVPHRGDMKLFWRRSNWQSLCHSCHSIKTATEDGGFGNPVRQAAR